MINIAIDCSKLNTKVKTGTHRFLIGFIDELCKRKGIKLTFYFNKFDKDLVNYSFLKKGEVKILDIRFYTQVGLLNEVRKYDYFLFPWQTVPVLSFLSSGNVVSIIHDYGYTFKTKIFTFFAQIFSKKIFSVSKYTANSLSRDSVVITEGVDTQIFFKIKEVDLLNYKIKYQVPDKFILSVGRIEERKNIFNNLEAFKIVSKFYPSLKYCFIGSFEIEEELIYSYIDRLGIERDKIMFKKYVSDIELNVYLNSCELLVFTSKEEGFGLPVLEAYSVGKWVILSKIQQLAGFSLIANQLVDPNSPKEISECIIYFLSNKQKLKKVFKPDLVLEENSWKKSVDLFLEGINDEK